MDPKDKGLSRRTFIHIGISAGFALAVTPITAGAISTPSDGIESKATKLPTNKGDMPVFIASPKGKGPFPVVLVVHEIFGVHEYIQDVCRRLAKEGYMAVAPYLYFREGEVSSIKEISDIVSKVVSKVKQDQVIADLDHTVEFLRADKRADTRRLAITGFCWGGQVTWMYAAHNPAVKAGVAWYGRLVNTDRQNNDKAPIDIAPTLTVPVLGLYGGKDNGIPLASVEAMRTAVHKGKSGSDIRVFKDAEHGFHADYRPSYHEASAKEGWSNLLTWFKEHGVTR